MEFEAMMRMLDNAVSFHIYLYNYFKYIYFILFWKDLLPIKIIWSCYSFHSSIVNRISFLETTLQK